jgi:serine/threonine-protein kinase
MSRMTDRVGRVLGGRYRLLALIGSGATAQVYLADDERLGRQVAVKMLHPLLADDLGFSRRFESEARRAAGLSSANVVAVYDWGDDNGPYLVTEYLDGGSLRDALDAGRRLSLSQSLVVGLETARGLAHAHGRGLVHRDVKPANLLFSADGRLRVADFGVARALAEAALTDPSSAAPGTARYASPEQARGLDVGPPGDVYAVALVMVEAVTGVVPFVADTTLGTLMARTDSSVEVPETFGALRGPIEHAGQLDPARRPTAANLAGALMEAAERLPPPAPLPLARLTVSLVDDDPTLVPEVRHGESDTTAALWLPATDVAAPVSAPTGADEVREAQEPDPSSPPESPLFDQDRHDRRIESPDAAPAPGRRRRRWPLIVAAVLVIAALGGAGALVWSRSQVPSYEVPDLVGLQVSELNALVGENGWKIEQREDRRDGSEPGEILAQVPAAGEQLDEGGALVVTVSLGSTLAAPPTDLVGLSVDDARVRIEQAGFEVGEIVESHSEDVTAGTVLSVPPQPPELEKGTPIDLEVSLGPAPRTIPDGLAGRSFDEAAAILGDLGLDVARAEDSSETVAEGLVIGSDPVAGVQVERGSTVTVTVSTGPPVVVIPDLSGLSPADAADRLEGLGLVVGGTRGPPNRTVVGTDPAAGTTVRRGSQVTIVSGRDDD